MDNLLNYFSKNITNTIKEYLNNCTSSFEQIEEIRIRANKPLIVKQNDDEIVFQYIVKTEDILETLERVCENSIYTYQNQICNGFITIKGGHRVGVTGNAVVESNKIININYISGLNFRIAKQIFDCSNKLIKYAFNLEKNTIYNTLIVSPPGAGKTTILRDLIRKISSGFYGFSGINVGLVDERGEIAAMYKGVPQNDVGIRTDILDNVPKAMGMKLLIRSMAPKVIVADEIGGENDVEIINYAICSGIKGIFTAHGGSIQDLMVNPAIKKLIYMNILERIVFLEHKEIKEIYYLNTKNLKYEVLFSSKKVQAEYI